MRLLWLLTTRSLRRRPLRVLLSTFGILLGVAAILAIELTNRAALDSITNLFQQTSGRASLVVTPAEASATGFSERALARVEDTPGVEVAAPVLYLPSQLASQAASGEIGLNFFGFSTGGLLLFGVDPGRDTQARAYRITQGEFLSNDLEARNIVLVESYASENDITVGQTIEVVAPSGLVKLRVVGLMAKEGAGQTNNGTFGVIPLGTAQKIAYRQGRLDQVDIVAAAGQRESAALAALKETLQARLGSDYAVIYPAAQGQRMSQMLGSYQIGLNFLSGVALFVGAFLIFNAFQMTVVERTREFGMLRTVGMTRAQVMRQVLWDAAVMGILGSALGVGLGLLLAQGLAQLMALLLGQELVAIRPAADVIITGVIIGVSVAVMAAGLPAWQAGRTSPLEALRARAQSRPGWLLRRGWLPGAALLVFSAAVLIANPFPYDVQFRMGSLVVFALFLGGALIIPASVNLWERALRPLIRLVFGGSGRLGSSNVRRAQLRTALTVAALMIGVAMVVIVWAMTDSFKGDLDIWLKGYVGGDLYITSPLSLGKDVWRRLEAVDGVAAVAPVRYFEVKWRPPGGGEEALTFMAIDPASHSRVTSFVYSQAEPDPAGALVRLAGGDAVYVSSILAEKYGLQPGDSLWLQSPGGMRPFLIAAVVVDYYNQGLVVSGSWLDMNRYFRQKDANAFMIKVAAGYAPDEVKQRIDDLYGRRDRLIIESNQALLGRVSTLMTQAFSLFDVLALISLFVGFMGITNTLTMNVMERRREIGMLRAVGMTRAQVGRMVVAEAALIGLVGGILGVIFGVILARIFMLAMTAMSGYKLTFLLPAARVGLALLAAVIVAVIAALLPALRAARTRILEAIQYE